MGKMFKYLTVYFILIVDSCYVYSTPTDLASNCDYVLCKRKTKFDADSQKGDYYASGSAISSQFVMPDGSVVTDSKGSSISSDGIQRTFHQLKQEADKYVAKKDDFSSGSFGVPKINLPGIKFPHPVFTSESSSQNAANQQQSSFASGSFQSGGSGSGSVEFVQQYQPSVPQTSKVTSYSKEQEVKKFVSKSGSSFPVSDGEFDFEQSKGDANVVYVRRPSITQEIRVVGGSNDGESEANRSASSSFQKFESNSQVSSSSSGSNQPVFLPNIKPNTFTTGFINFGANQQAAESLGQRGYIGNIAPKYKDAGESHYANEEEQQQQEHRVVAQPVHFPDEDNNHIKFDELNAQSQSGYVNQYGHENRSGQRTVVRSHIGPNGLPTARLEIKVNAPSAGGAQTYRKETSSSHTRVVQQGDGQPVPVYVTEVRAVPASAAQSLDGVNVIPSSSDYSSSAAHEKEKSLASSQTYVVQSPILLGGVPQPIELEKAAATNGGRYYYKEVVGSPDDVRVPIAAEQGVAKQSSSASSSSYHYTSGSSVAGGSQIGVGEPLVPNSDYFIGGGSGSSQSADSRLSHSSSVVAEPCTICEIDVVGRGSGQSGAISGGKYESSGSYGASSSYGVSGGGGAVYGTAPVKNSYGIATSFSSSSSNVNGKKSESREASVHVNDNGKTDSYHVKS